MKLTKSQFKYHALIVVALIALNFFSDYIYNSSDDFSLHQFPLLRLKAKYYIYYITLNVVFFIIYVINYALVCPRTLAKKKYFYFEFAVIGLIFTFAGLRYFLEEIVVYNIIGQHNYFEESRRFGYYIFDNSFFAIKATLYSTLLFLFFEYRENKNRVHLLEIDRKKAELNFLKSQIEPHFLFNTLNTFYGDLIDNQPKIAKDIHRLSELLRYVTYEASRDFIAINKEIKFLEDYIYFYKKRFEDSLSFEYALDGTVGGQLIPSFILIHFIENIFKHGVINCEEHPAQLKINITNTHIHIETKNQISLSDTYTNKGIGKENLERRLKAIYDSNYELQYDETDDVFSAYLKVPFKS